MELAEMGGYLPLELNDKGDFFRNIPSKYILEVNTGRTAIYCALLSLRVKKVFVPYFYCPDILAMLRNMDLEIILYRIDEEFLPVNVNNESDAAIILVNYYGVLGNKIQLYAKKFNNVIFDHAHAFYDPPVIDNGVMNIYSCRKFFGVCDGAYLVGKDIQSFDLQQDISYKRAIHLLKSIELGTNSAYSESKESEEQIGTGFFKMSLLTRKILGSIDYDSVAQKRIDNFAYLHEELADLQLLKIPEFDYVPYVYPLMLDRDIHRELVSRCIYIPILWKEMLEQFETSSIEYNFASRIVTLPIDQRYNIKGMKCLVKIVREIIKG